jgi:FO synthase subunit 2
MACGKGFKRGGRGVEPEIKGTSAHLSRIYKKGMVSRKNWKVDSLLEKALKIRQEIKEILEKALDGRRINREEALELMGTNGNDLLFVSLVANEIRKRKVGEIVTYVVNRNINFTNICTGGCRFCAFRRSKEDSDAYLLNLEEVVKKAKEAKRLGATEVCIQGGLHPDIDLDFYSEMLKRIKKEVDIHIHAFSPMEVSYAAEKMDMSTKEALKYLKEAGLDSIPGTAAEILDDKIRGIICPKKIKSNEWIAIIKEAHRLEIPTTATMMYGHIENEEKQIKHLEILREIQDSTHGFTEFVPLSFVHFNSPLYLSHNSKSGATGTEDMKVYAISRIFLDNFGNIQASWIKLGRKFAQAMLNFGANDLGGTLMEENISRSAGINTEIISKGELERMILEAGRIPRQRDTLYKLISKQKIK